MSSTTTNTSKPQAKKTNNGHNPERHELEPLADVQQYLTQYAREKPEMCALGCLLVGFVLGWKLKPW